MTSRSRAQRARSPEAQFRRDMRADALAQDRAAGCRCPHVKARIVKLADTPDNNITVATSPHNADCVLYRETLVKERDGHELGYELVEGVAHHSSDMPLALPTPGMPLALPTNQADVPLDIDAATRPDNKTGGLWLPPSSPTP